jgi:hypothetical protein
MMLADAAAIPDGIPGWVTIVSSGIGLAVAVYLWVSGQFKGLPKATSDVIVPSMTIADSQAIRQLASELQVWAMDRRNDLSMQQQILQELRENNRLLGECWRELRNRSRGD